MGNPIFIRRSIRKYSTKPVTNDKILQLLKAAMAAPSARDNKEWCFYVIRDKKLLSAFVKVHSGAAMIIDAQCGILVCADSKLQEEIGYMALDCAAATQNILLEATALGIGSCWIGVYPRTERMTFFKEQLQLPDQIIPMTLISIGSPGEEKPPRNAFFESKIQWIDGLTQ
jgi:Nitroreductase